MGDNFVDYNVDDGIAQRIVWSRSGGPLTSTIEVSSEAENLTDHQEIFDKSWLCSLKAPDYESGTKTINVVDLFAGAGGLSLGASEGLRALQMNAKHLLVVDNDERSAESFRQNFESANVVCSQVENLIDGNLGQALTRQEKMLGSLTGQIDLLLGGPPCQGNSGYNNFTRYSDSKNELYVRMARFAEIFTPANIVIENVPGVVHDRNRVVQRTWECLASLGYKISEGIVDSADIGVPQKRRRHLTIASLSMQPDISQAVINVRTSLRNTEWAIRDLCDSYCSANLMNSSSIPNGLNRKRIQYLFDNGMYDLPDSERPPCHQNGGHTYGSVYGRLRWEFPSQTITTGFGGSSRGRFIHPSYPRTLTPREAARLQFFPDFYKFATESRVSLQNMIGNAAPSKLGFMAALHLFR